MKARPEARRRALLCALGALAAGCAAPLPPRGPAGKALVIGAGFAGLSAARALRQSGWQVTVLEARQRIGGRVLTETGALGQRFDLGPSWLHGGPQNPLKPLAAAAGVATRVTDYGNMRFTVRQGNSARIVPRSEVLRFTQLFFGQMESAGLWSAIETMAADAGRSGGHHLSVAEVFDAAVQRIEAANGPADRSLVTLQRWILESNLAAPLEEVGFAALLDESDTADSHTLLPEDDRFVTGGMAQLTRLLALDLDIRLGAAVQQVQWQPGRVRAHTGSGTHEADTVVVTIPVGLLAKGSITFVPALPIEKIAAAKRLPMGLLNKAYVRFPEAFWERKVDFLTTVANPPPLYYAWLNLLPYTGAPALLGFTSGSRARDIERMSDAVVRAAIFSRLRAARSASVPEPIELHVSRWGADPWAGGSYSFLGLGATSGDRATLGAPVANTLFFAGEATHVDDPASVHGAWWSGLRAAKEVLGAA